MDRLTQILKQLILIILILLLSISLGVYSGLINTDNTVSTTIIHSSLSAEVNVYRDEFGIPTIIGKTISDILFAQGFEYTRDRGFQLEVTRSVTNGELMRLFGDDLYVADEFLRTLGMKRSAELIAEKTDPMILQYIQRYVDGINYYFESHQFNLPIELTILGVSPKHWEVTDVLAVQGLMAYDLSWGNINSELRNLEFIQNAGMEAFVELYPIANPNIRNYLMNFDEPLEMLSFKFENPLNQIFNEYDIDFTRASNNWVVSPDKSATGNALIANDPHLGLTTPSIWWKVQLIAIDDDFHVQGFALPGTPFITVGHNKYIAWGVTNTGTDAIDLFYMRRNDTHYNINNTWYEIERIPEVYSFSNGTEKVVDILVTEFGPLMEFRSGDNITEYAFKWTLNEIYDRDQIVYSIYSMNRADSVDSFLEALEYFSVPGQNIVFATIDGDIGYQLTGIIPIRKNGYGLFPKNATTGLYDWIGVEDYDLQLRIINPNSGYFATANQRIDNRFIVHITEDYDEGYRAKRINQVLANGTNFDADINALTVEDMKNLQLDTYTTAADDFLSPFLSVFSEYSYSLDQEFMNEIISILQNWNYRMDIKEIGATIFEAYRRFLVHETFMDELGIDLATRFNTKLHDITSKLLNTNHSSHWFNDLTTDIIETAEDIAVRALDKTVQYLVNRLGTDLNNWEYGKLHQLTINHQMGGVLPIFNKGPQPAPGSALTVNAIGGVRWSFSEDNGANLNYQTSFGPSMRYVAEVEPKWLNILGILPVGISGNIMSPNYDNFFEPYLVGEYYQWIFTDDVNNLEYKVEITYRKEE
jgi:penicillin G amidase